MSEKTELPIVLIGGGGHAAVLMDALLQRKREILAIISPDSVSQRPIFNGIPCLKNDEDIRSFNPKEVMLVNGLGMLPRSLHRQSISKRFKSMGYRFETVIASGASVSCFAALEEGVQVLSGAIVQAGAHVGEGTILNTGAIIEHDCMVGSYNHIAPRATLCGQVATQDNVYIGAGATVIQGLSLGENCIVGAGATLVRSLDSKHIAYGARAEIRAI